MSDQKQSDASGIELPEARWSVASPAEGETKALRSSPLTDDYPDLLLRLLAQRGIDNAEKAERFLHPRLKDLHCPFELPGMQKAVDRLLKAIDEGERVLLFGDYDVDGVTSTTLMRAGLRAYGLNPEVFLPHRIDDGYGLTEIGLARCLEKYKPQLVVAIDCGTNDCESVQWLRDRGVDAVIFDHHEVAERGPADCAAVVNPKRGSEYTYLCSAGVVFKVVHALLKSRPIEGFDLKHYLDMIAVGTIADIVPLVGENRILVRRGLGRLAKTTHPGLAALMKVAGVPQRVLSSHVSFRLGPRINAAGRIEHAHDSLKLMTEGDDVKAKKRADLLDTHNRNRQELERRIVAEADEQILKLNPEGRKAIVIGADGWHPGVVGIVASRVMRDWHRPAIVVGFNEAGLGKGSGRSVPGVNLIAALDACRDHLVNGGGHEQAVGVTIERDSFTDFRQAFEQAIDDATEPDALDPELSIDQIVDFAEVPYEFLDYLELLEPFGSGNRLPVFASGPVYPASEPRLLGDGKHIKLLLSQGGHRRDAVWFNAPQPLPEPPWDIAFTMERNEFRGNSSLQFHIRALRTSQAR